MSVAGRGRWPMNGRRVNRHFVAGLTGAAKPGPIPFATTPTAEYAFDPTADHPALITELAIGTTDRFDNTPTWTRIHDPKRGVNRISSLTVHTGRQALTDVFQPSTADHVADNSDRVLDPDSNPAITTGIRVRDRAVWGSRTYELFTGFDRSGFPQSYMPPSKAMTEINATDLLTDLANAALPSDPYASLVRNDPSLVAWWRFNESSGSTALDSGPNGWNGTYIGEPTLGVAGLMGSDSAISVDIGSDVEVNGLDLKMSTMTIDMVVAHDPTVGVVDHVIFSYLRPLDSNYGQFWVALLSSGAVRVSYTAYVGGVGGSFQIDSNVRIDDSQPHLIQVAGLNPMVLLIDGVLQSSGVATPNSVDLVTGNSKIAFGSEVGAQDFESFSGTIDEIAIFESVYYSGNDHAAAALGWPGDTTGVRLGHILDIAGVAETERDIDTGHSTIAAARFSGTQLDYAQKTSDTESGQLYIDQVNGGRLRFENRYRRILDTRSTVSQATFTDDPAATTGYRYEPDNLRVIPADPTTVINDVTVGWAGGSEHADDLASQQQYGHISRSITTDLSTVEEARALAEWLISRYKNPTRRITGLTLNPSADKRLYDVALGLNIGDRITIRRHPQGVGSAWQADMIVEGKDHTISGGIDVWTTTLYVSNVDTGRYILWDGTDGWDGTAGWAF